jgi:hypothetical protein
MGENGGMGEVVVFGGLSNRTKLSATSLPFWGREKEDKNPSAIKCSVGEDDFIPRRR